LRDDISNLSLVEKNFNERNHRKVAGEMPKKEHSFSDNSSKFGSFSSEASRINFWKELHENIDVGENVIVMSQTDAPIDPK